MLRERRRLGIVIASLICLMMTLSFVPVAKAATMNVTMHTPTVYGVHADFGFIMYYTPSDVTVSPGDSVIIGYSPGPAPMYLYIDVLGLLSSIGVTLNSPLTDVTGWINNTAALLGIPDDPWTLPLNLTGTPLGSFVLEEIPVWEGIPMYLDIALNAQLKCEITTTGGSLDHEQYSWTTWGGREVNLTAPQNAGDITVSAQFSYIVSNSYNLRIDIPLIYTHSWQILSFPLGTIEFQDPVQTHVSVVSSGGGSGSGSESLGTTAIGLTIGALVGGLMIGVVIDRFVLQRFGRNKGKE